MSEKEILFFRYCHNETTQEEERQVHRLLSCSEESRKEMDILKKAIDIENRINDLSSHDTETGYEKMLKKVSRYESRKRTWQLILKACAVIVIPLLISVTALSVVNISLVKQLDDRGWQEICASPGTIANIDLPDSSRVWINSGSTLRYPSRFKKGKRQVFLKGEAYFEVHADTENPFCVTTASGLEVSARGTKFNVSCYEDDFNEEVSLSEGVVYISVDKKERCRLNPGETCLYTPETESIQINDVNIYEKTAWTEGKIIFRNASLEDVFKRLGRRYNIDFIFHDPYGLSDDYKCRITFKDETIRQAMNYLQIAAPLRYSSEPAAITDSGALQRQQIHVWLDRL